MGLKWPENQASGSHFQHTPKSSSSKHIKQDWVECFEKMTKERNFDLFRVPDWPENRQAFGAIIIHTSKIAQISLKFKFHVNQDTFFYKIVTPSSLWYKAHFSRQLNCRRCSN